MTSGWARYDPPAEPAPDPRRPRPARALRRGVALCYDYLAVTVGASSLWTLATLCLLAVTGTSISPPRRLLTPPGLLAALALIAGESLLAAGLIELAKRMVERDDPSLIDLWTGMRRLGGRALALGLLSAVVASALATDARFLANRPQLMLQVVAVPMLYLLAALGLMQVSAWPLLARQRLNAGRAFIQAGLLLLDNPLFVSILGLSLLLLGTVSVVTAVPLVLFFPTFAAVTCLCALDDLLAKYEALKAPAE